MASPDETEHKVRVEDLGGVWGQSDHTMQATCSCGWQGKRDFMPREVAEAEARRHLAFVSSHD
jgi:hypothetical protein